MATEQEEYQEYLDYLDYLDYLESQGDSGVAQQDPEPEPSDEPSWFDTTVGGLGQWVPKLGTTVAKGINWFGDLVGSDTISNFGEETADLGEKWQSLEQQAYGLDKINPEESPWKKRWADAAPTVGEWLALGRLVTAAPKMVPAMLGIEMAVEKRDQLKDEGFSELDSSLGGAVDFGLGYLGGKVAMPFLNRVVPKGLTPWQRAARPIAEGAKGAITGAGASIPLGLGNMALDTAYGLEDWQNTPEKLWEGALGTAMVTGPLGAAHGLRGPSKAEIRQADVELKAKELLRSQEQRAIEEPVVEAKEASIQEAATPAEKPSIADAANRFHAAEKPSIADAANRFHAAENPSLPELGKRLNIAEENVFLIQEHIKKHGPTPESEAELGKAKEAFEQAKQEYNQEKGIALKPQLEAKLEVEKAIEESKTTLPEKSNGMYDQLQSHPC